MSDEKKVQVTLRAAILIAGVHHDVGETVDVDVALGERLVRGERAVPAGKGDELPAGAEGRQNTAKGLTAAGGGAPLIKR